MQLPSTPDGQGVQIGISDVLAWRECPARFVFGMKRHDEGGESPESWSPANSYGSAIHHAIHLVDDGLTEDEAIQDAFAQWSEWLEPDDLDLMRHDLQTYLERDPMGVRTLLSEDDCRVPLFEHPEVGQVYFRFKLDRLYQVIARPNELIHIDYKSSKWSRTEKEVSEDLQMWAYNWGIHEVVADLYPEIEGIQLSQIYDQLRYGQVPTRKSVNQREQMKRWLITAITAMIADEELAPKFNPFCPWCSIKMDCPVVQNDLSEWARARIAACMPREPKLKKDGTPGKVLGPPKLDPERFEEYAALLPDVKRARQVLEAFEKNVHDVIKLMPIDRQGALRSRDAPFGYEVAHRNRKTFSVEGKRLAHEEMGDAFYLVAGLSVAALERLYGDDKAAIEEITRHQVDGAGFDVIEARRA